ncbi:MAG: ATP-dependent Clp protease proteolytic subunit [Planctomycetota bacterium]|jgi:membrane-bound serine protease (ClpP class)|nr:ATP-dependent Clp protease proteolytic subunit [Planctomycetota bacterium]
MLGEAVIRIFLGLILAAIPAAAGEDRPEPKKPAWRDELEAGPEWGGRVVAIPVAGAILGAPFSEMAAMLEAALDRAERERPRLVVLEIDSPGGQVDACDRLARRIFELKVPVVSLVIHKAVSGGAMLATAAGEIAMTRVARIGDIQPMQMSITGGGAGMDDRTAEKIEVDIRTIMKVFAEHYDRPVAVVEAMVSRSSSLYQVRFEGGGMEFVTGSELEVLEENIRIGRDSRRIAGSKIIKPEGRLLELSAREALEYGLASEMVENADDFYAARGIEKGEVIRPKLPEGEGIDFRKLIPSVEDLGLPVWVIVLLGVFLVVGVAGLVTEFQAPGSGIPAAIGIIGFVCFFSTLLMHDRGSPLGIAVFLIGVGLLVVEIMVLPGFGAPGIAGIVGILGGLLLAFTPNWDSPYMARFMWHEVGSFTLLLFFGTAAAFLAIWAVSEYGEKMPFLGRLFLTQAQEAGINPHPLEAPPPERGEGDRLRPLAGRGGIAETMLRPSGKVRLDSGELVDVVTEGVYVESGGRVVVRGIQGNWLVVAPDRGPGPGPEGNRA